MQSDTECEKFNWQMLALNMVGGQEPMDMGSFFQGCGKTHEKNIFSPEPPDDFSPVSPISDF